MFNRLVFCVVALATMFSASLGAWAEERFALVIGNSNYQNVPALANPARDADAVSGLLQMAGFEVTKALDLSQKGLRRSLGDFTTRLAGKGRDTVVLVYFAGHGVQIDGENYLLPVDASVRKETDVPIESVRLADVMNLISAIPSKARIVILDACRNNPFDQIKDTTGKGLAIVNAPAGTVVAYSTSPGATAEDGWNGNSPFTSALVDKAREPGAAIGAVLQSVREKVHTETNGQQTPWDVTALTRPFSFFPGDAPVEAEPEEEKTEDQWRKELWAGSPRDAYNTVIRVDNITVYNIFLTLYPHTVWTDRIRSIAGRRQEMLDWFDAVTINTIEAFEVFLARYPDSDLALTAERLKKRARPTITLATADTRGLSALEDEPEPEIREVVKWRTRVVEKEIPVTKWKTRTVVKVKEVPVTKWKTRTVVKVKEIPVIKWKTRIRNVVKWKTKVVVRERPVIKYRTRTVIKRVQVPRRCPRGGHGQTLGLRPLKRSFVLN